MRLMTEASINKDNIGQRKKMLWGAQGGKYRGEIYDTLAISFILADHIQLNVMVWSCFGQIILYLLKTYAS